METKKNSYRIRLIKEKYDNLFKDDPNYRISKSGLNIQKRYSNG